MAMNENQEPVEPLIPRDTFGLRLIMLRHELDLTVDQISAQCGIASATWSTWENGVRPRGLDDVVRKIVENTGADREWLMWGQLLLRREGEQGELSGPQGLIHSPGQMELTGMPSRPHRRKGDPRPLHAVKV